MRLGIWMLNLKPVSFFMCLLYSSVFSINLSFYCGVSLEMDAGKKKASGDKESGCSSSSTIWGVVSSSGKSRLKEETLEQQSSFEQEHF